jgi:hypothetical protein
MIPVLIKDLIFRSKIIEAANGVAEIQFFRSVTDLPVAPLLIVDLSAAGDLSALSALVSQGSRVVGFFSHVDHELEERAEAAGIEAMPRSKFVKQLASLLNQK